MKNIPSRQRVLQHSPEGGFSASKVQTEVDLRGPGMPSKQSEDSAGFFLKALEASDNKAVISGDAEHRKAASLTVIIRHKDLNSRAGPEERKTERDSDLWNALIKEPRAPSKYHAPYTLQKRQLFISQVGRPKSWACPGSSLLLSSLPPPLGISA